MPVVTEFSTYACRYRPRYDEILSFSLFNNADCYRTASKDNLTLVPDNSLSKYR